MRRRTFIGSLGAGLALAAGAGGSALAQAAPAPSPFQLRLARGARAQVGVTTLYDPSYVRLDYPGGDLPIERGVCTDVVIRAFRAAGVDLQKAVHEDMAANFSAYPRDWGLRRPDRNIDHRRVPNLETFFTRRGGALAFSRDPGAFAAGDVVTWRLAGSGLPHCGVVSEETLRGERLVVHNIGGGALAEPVLFEWPVTRCFRFASWD